MSTRVIVFGSRNWPLEYAGYIATQLAHLHSRFAGPITIVHGACPSGADAIADHYARVFRYVTELHPADWTQHGRRAGPVRNQEMAASAPAIAIGFRMPGKSNGTDDMFRACGRHRVAVERHGWGWP